MVIIEADGYIRVSRVAGRSGDSFISPDVQRKQIARWAELREVSILEWHTDLDQSGAKDDRPGLTAVLERIEAGLTGGIVVAKLDRFARSLTAALEAIRRIDQAGGKFVSVTEGIDPTTPAGKLQQNIMLVFAEFELDRIRESWLTAQQRAVERGVHIASMVPTGYVRGEDGRLEPHPVFGVLVAEMFARRASGDSWGALAEYLDASGVVGPYGAKLWRTAAVSKIVRNRVYLGEARSGRFTNPDAHPPLVERSVWEAAQGVRALSVARSKEGSLLAGLLRCAGCRYAVKPDTMRLHNGEQARIYRCRGKHSSGACPSPCAVMGTVIEPFVVKRFFDGVGTVVAHSNDDADLEAAEDALDAADAELRHYRDSERIADVLGPDSYVDGLQARVRAVDEAARHLGELHQRTAGLTTLGQMDLREMWPELGMLERRKLLGAWFDVVMIRSGRRLPIEDRVSFVLHGDGPGDFPRRGRRTPLVSWPWPDAEAQAGVELAQDPEPGLLD